MSTLAPDREAGWWVLGTAFAVLLGYVVYSFVGTVVLGLFLYYATRPIHRRLRRRVRPPSLAAAVSLFALALPALLLVGYALLVAVREAQRVAPAGQLDPARYIGVGQRVLDRVVEPEALLAADPAQYVTAGTVRSVLGSLGSAAETLAVVGVGAIHAFVVVAIAFYLLRDDHRLSRWVRSRFGDDRGVLEEYMNAVDRDLDSVFFGNILNAVFTGTIGVIVYSLLNVAAPPELAVPVPALVGLLAGVASLIPVIGMKLVYLPVAGVLAARSVLIVGTETLWFVAAFLVLSLVLVDTIPDLLLRPYVSGRSLHVGSLMLAYTLGPLLFGWYGLFLMPMLLVLVVQFARVVLPRVLDPEPIRPYAVDPTYLDGGDELAGTGFVPASARLEDD